MGQTKANCHHEPVIHWAWGPGSLMALEAGGWDQVGRGEVGWVVVGWGNPPCDSLSANSFGHFPKQTLKSFL